VISIIIPNYNNGHFVKNAIESALNQRYRDFEVIVVDDGSTDNSRDVVASFGDRVRYIWQENRGLGGARNTGIRAAKGKLVGFLDADDEWLPTFLETMVALADQHPEAAIYYCSAQAMDVNRHELPQTFGGPVRPPEMMYQTLLRANFLIPSTILIRRSVVIEVGLFEQALRSMHGCEDWDLWLRLAPKYTFVGTPAILVRYRLHGSSFSANPAGMQRAVHAVIEKHFGPDDGQWHEWPPEKRRAYGGVYRYHALTSVQRQNNWEAGAMFLRQALQADPLLAKDLDLFYALALGAQPIGQRGFMQKSSLDDSANQIERMLATLFDWPALSSLHSQTYATAYYGLGLVAYNSGYLSGSRGFLLRALLLQPELWRDQRLIGNLIKSFAGRHLLSWLRMARSLRVSIAQ
jgi:glycosyltransferase involved in cell wall biosynthesis